MEVLDNIALWNTGNVLQHFCYYPEGPLASGSKSRCSYKFSTPGLAEFIDKGLSHCDIGGRLRIAVSVGKPIDFRKGYRDIIGVPEGEIRTVNNCHEAFVHRAKQELALYQDPVYLAHHFIQ